VKYWAGWVVKELGLSAFRFDAAQHFAERFTNEFVDNLEEKFSSIFKVENADLRKMFGGTLVKMRPLNAYYLRHKPRYTDWANSGNSGRRLLQAPAYGFMLLREEGYSEVFYSDLYGTKNEDKPEGPVPQIEDLVIARKLYAYGDRDDYFSDANYVGFVRRGTPVSVWVKKDAQGRDQLGKL